MVIWRKESLQKSEHIFIILYSMIYQQLPTALTFEVQLAQTKINTTVANTFILTIITMLQTSRFQLYI